MQQDEKLGLNPMESKTSEILTTEKMMIFLLIMKKKIRSHFLFMFCLNDLEFRIEKSSKLLAVIFYLE